MANSFCFWYIMESRAHFLALDLTFQPNSLHFNGLVRIPGQGGRDSGVDPVSIPKLIRSRFRDEAGHGFRF